MMVNVAQLNDMMLCYFYRTCAWVQESHVLIISISHQLQWLNKLLRHFQSVCRPCAHCLYLSKFSWPELMLPQLSHYQVRMPFRGPTPFPVTIFDSSDIYNMSLRYSFTNQNFWDQVADGFESCHAKTAVEETREETYISPSKCLEISSPWKSSRSVRHQWLALV